jgi:hypothetical protein
MSNQLDEATNPQNVPNLQKQLFVGFMEKYDSKDLGGKNYSYKKNILKMVEDIDKVGKNVCIFLEEDNELGGDINPNQHKLVGLHHLHCSAKEKELIGFRGYDFSSPVVLPPGSLIGPQASINSVVGHKDNPKSIPGYDDLIESDFLYSFLENNTVYHLKPGELKKAKEQINNSIMVDPYLYGQLQAGCGSNLDSIDPESLLTYLMLQDPIEENINKLVSFLWATAKGYNKSPCILSPAGPSPKIDDLVRKFST